jgi:hypothetical protein
VDGGSTLLKDYKLTERGWVHFFAIFLMIHRAIASGY